MQDIKTNMKALSSIHFWIAVGIAGFFLTLGLTEKRSIPTTILEALIVAPMVLGAWKLRSDYKSLLSSTIFISFLVYWLYSWLSVSWVGSEFHHGSGFMVRSYLYSLLFFLACAFCYREYGFEKFFDLSRFALPLVSVLACYSVIHFYFILDFPLHVRMNPIGRLMERSHSTFFYGFFLLTGLFAITRLQNPWSNSLLLIPILIAIILTGSRMAVFAILLSSIVLLSLTRPKAAIVFLVATMLSTAGVVFLLPENTEVLMERGYSFRLDIWSEAIKSMAANWIFGHGNNGMNFILEHTYPDGEVHIFHAHNIFISALYTGGILGLGLFIYIFIELIRFLGKKEFPAEKPFFMSLLLLNTAILLTDGNNIFPGPGVEFFGFLFPAGLILGMQLLHQKDQGSNL